MKEIYKGSKLSVQAGLNSLEHNTREFRDKLKGTDQKIKKIQESYEEEDKGMKGFLDDLKAAAKSQKDKKVKQMEEWRDNKLNQHLKERNEFRLRV